MRSLRWISVLLLALFPSCDQPSEHDEPPAEEVASRSDEERSEPPDDGAKPAEAPGDAAHATAPVPKPSASAALEYERNSIQVFRAVAPATVFVTQTRLVRDRWSRRAHEVESGTGSGFIWDSQGHVVTNFHVIAKARSLAVTLLDGKVYPAEFVGGDPRKDIAVLKIDAPRSSLVPIRLPDEGSSVDVGQKALAIGNPYGLDHTLTVGAISATGREVKGYGGVTIRDMLQTDASINPGNSGGPLLNSRGQLIGINTMIYSKSGSSAGVGFAVPVSTVRRLVPQIIRYGEPQRAGLGIEQVADSIARANGVKGVVIERVLPGSAAAKAGLRGLKKTRRGVFLGDVIVGVDSHEVTDFDSLYNALDRYEPGDTVTLKVVRNDETIEVEVELQLLD